MTAGHGLWVQVGGRWRECALLFMVRDLEGALGKRLLTSGRSLGAAWTHVGTLGDVWRRFWGQLSHHLKRLRTYVGGLGGSFDVLGQSWRFHGARQQKR